MMRSARPCTQVLFRSHILVLSCVWLWMAACSLEDLIPKVGQSRNSARLSAEVAGANAHSLPRGVDGLRFEIIDVAIHGPDGEDAWWLVNNEEMTFEFDGETETLSFETIPVLAGSYDLVRVSFGDVRVLSGNKWQKAKLVSEHLEVAPKGRSIRGNVLLKLMLSGSSSVSGSMASGWTVNPKISASIVADLRDDDDSSESGEADEGSDGASNATADAGESEAEAEDDGEAGGRDES